MSRMSRTTGTYPARCRSGAQNDERELRFLAGPDSAYRTLSRVSYCEDFGWRFGRRPLSLLLIGLLDSPSERMSSIWDSLHVRSPSVGILNGLLAGLATVEIFFSFASSGMMAILLLGECVPLTAAL